MVDILPLIAEKLRKYCPVELSYPDIVTDCPLATLTEVANTTEEVINGVERMTYHSVQIDVWDKTEKGVISLAKAIRAEIIACGFFCDTGNLEEGSYPRHYKMRFRGKVDNLTYKVYQ